MTWIDKLLYCKQKTTGYVCGERKRQMQKICLSIWSRNVAILLPTLRVEDLFNIYWTVLSSLTISGSCSPVSAATVLGDLHSFIEFLWQEPRHWLCHWNGVIEDCIESAERRGRGWMAPHSSQCRWLIHALVMLAQVGNGLFVIYYIWVTKHVLVLATEPALQIDIVAP